MDGIKPLMDALTVHTQQYKSYGDYSATSLIDTPRVVALKKRHGHKVIMEPMQQIASFIGTGVHNYFERTLEIASGVRGEYELERRIFDKIGGRIVTGQFDIFHNQEDIYDIKTCKTWKIIFDPDHLDWAAQQNIYAWLLRRRGVDVKSINIMAVFQDWTRGMAMRSRSYPKQPVMLYNLPMWSDELTERFVHDRLEQHKAAELLPDDKLPECSREERWERFPDGQEINYAVLPSRDAKRARRVVGTLEEAYDFCRAQKKITPEWVIEVRYAERTRCEQWCEVNQYCNHYRDYMAAKKSGTLNEYIPVTEVI